MNSELPTCSQCFGLYDENDIVGFCAVLHQPHGVNKRIKRCCRLVVLPDYQGIGLGTKLLNCVAEYYHSLNYDFSIVTSAKNMIYALNKSDKWTLIRYSVNSQSNKKSAIDYNRKSMRNNCKTASFFYRGM